MNRLKKTVTKFKQCYKFILLSLSGIALSFFSALVVAASTPITNKNLGDIGTQITYSFYGLAQLITAGAYIAGIGFALTSILKFKAHKDNPTQIPIGTPIALLFVAGALLFLPNLFGIAGYSIFGSTSGLAGIYGSTGL